MLFYLFGDSYIYIPMNWQDILGILNFIVLTLTGIVVWMYTKAAQRSNEIQEQPILNFNFIDSKIQIKNIGKGPAYNPSIEKFDLAGYSYRFYLESTLLEPGDFYDLKMVAKTPDGGLESPNTASFLDRLVPKVLTPEAMQHKPAIFLIHFQGINSDQYHTIFSFYCDVPPAGDMIMQFIRRGKGALEMKEAQKIALEAERIKSSVED